MKHYKIVISILFILYATFCSHMSFAQGKKKKGIQYEEVVIIKNKTHDTIIVDTFPKYPGGLKGFQNDIYKNLVISDKYKKNELYNTSLLLNFNIDTNGVLIINDVYSLKKHVGDYNELEIYFTSDNILIESVKNALSNLSPWQAAIWNGVKVDYNYQMGIPIVIRPRDH